MALAEAARAVLRAIRASTCFIFDQYTPRKFGRADRGRSDRLASSSKFSLWSCSALTSSSRCFNRASARCCVSQNFTLARVLLGQCLRLNLLAHSFNLDRILRADRLADHLVFQCAPRSSVNESGLPSHLKVWSLRSLYFSGRNPLRRRLLRLCYLPRARDRSACPPARHQLPEWLDEIRSLVQAGLAANCSGSAGQLQLAWLPCSGCLRGHSPIYWRKPRRTKS